MQFKGRTPGTWSRVFHSTLWCAAVVSILCLIEATPSFAQPHFVDTTKSEGLAFTSSFLGTVLPVVAAGLIIGDPDTASDGRKLLGGCLSLAGFLVGPSLGHVYAGNESAISLGAGIRMTGIAVVGVGAVYNASQPESPDSKTGDIISAAGLTVLLAGTLTDWIRAPMLLHKQKEAARIAQPNRIGLHVSPNGLKLLIQVG